jgi:hypothetical protein
MISPKDAARLDAWFTTLVLRYRLHVLAFDENADQWGGLWRFIQRSRSRMVSSSRRPCSTASPSRPATFDISSGRGSGSSIRFDGAIGLRSTWHRQTADRLQVRISQPMRPYPFAAQLLAG